ncbi:glycoside hydrolase family 3 C-terminal domain-containing protein [Aestuariimicrobium ganziense]|uniref:glycoside hydrolase family 3 C-terminal domain-containing protein n=1 Tax=Aestuariimicrobium ganziense TaxID=2773677 RepID=UPI0019459E41|nr:glycoside hydrolase family 3 C-terminal domain-containing protein [Aestuariimicrobium ganziense]
MVEAFGLGAEQHGEDAMRARFELSATRLLRGMFRVGLFDDPYLDADHSRSVVGCPEFVAAGLQAQTDSIVHLKGDAAPVAKGAKVWLPRRRIAGHKGFFRQPVPPAEVDALDLAVAGDYVTLVDSPDEADVAVVAMNSPMSDPYVDEKFRPLSLQYRPYHAETAREQSLAGDRAYRGVQSVVANEADLDNLEAAREAMGDRPVVAVVKLDSPVVMTEVEPLADALFVHYGVSTKALLDVLTGAATAGGRLPASMPADMVTIEAHHEDVFDDYTPYTDTVGNTYRTGFGLGHA